MIREYFGKIRNNPLLGNSLFLIMATGLMAVFGFVFWLMAARLFSASDIGLATTLVAIMNLIGALSLLGFDTAFIRFLPSSDHKNSQINTGFIVVGIAAALLSVSFLILVPVISPPLLFIRENIFIALAFVFFCTMTAWNMLSDSVFLSEGHAEYTLYTNTIFSSLRLLFVIIFMQLAAAGIFFAIALSQFIGIAINIAVLIWKFKCKPHLAISTKALKRVWKYSAYNYIGAIFNLLPGSIIPIMVLNTLGSTDAGYYSIAIMIGNLLYAIPWSGARSLFAESSRNEGSIVANVKKTGTLIAALMLPPSIILYLAGDHILLLFGKEYSLESFELLRLLIITGAAVSSLAILETFFRTRGNPSWLMAIHASFAFVTIGLGYALVPFGLIGIGIAWLCGYSTATIVGMVILKTSGKQPYHNAPIPAT